MIYDFIYRNISSCSFHKIIFNFSFTHYTVTDISNIYTALIQVPNKINRIPPAPSSGREQKGKRHVYIILRIRRTQRVPCTLIYIKMKLAASRTIRRINIICWVNAGVLNWTRLALSTERYRLFAAISSGSIIFFIIFLRPSP